MKKRLLSVLLLICFVTAASAQGLHYGIKADLNMFKLDGEGIKSNYTLGGRLGVYGSYDFSKKWGLQPELLFSQASPKRDDNFSAKYINTANATANQSVKLTYLTLPVLLRYNVNHLLTINAGPQYSYLIYANENLLNYNRNAFKRGDLGVAAGATFNFDILHVYARYVLGLTDVNDIDDRYQWKTQQAQVGIGIDIK
ncbi:porin family protein [Chitinophaga arvensicola]|uniref:Outer membrane protein beta-barrel domain-containing protein n=1 Tax=Chitinophaga arvensicola TaxID=29529 RepID=A0A1I0RF70_9BACT|nr:porin family protein [Chitinophaga arvensicola]SEW39545.1 Outer membrane protein beta-barrel domain-containing protein [Chitinophaga arvensicola]